MRLQKFVYTCESVTCRLCMGGCREACVMRVCAHVFEDVVGVCIHVLCA